MAAGIRMIALGFLTIGIILLNSSCRRIGGTSPAWDAYVSQFLDAYFAAHPDVAVIAGRHEFDGKLPDWSADGIRKEIQRLHTERERAQGFKDEALDERQRFER